MKNKVIVLNDETIKALSWEDAIKNDDSGFDAWKLENQAQLDAATIMSLFYSEDWVYICCDLLASEFATPWPRVMRQEVVNGRAVNKPAEGHPLQNLLDDPTLYAGAQQFWYRAGVFDTLLGNCFFWYMKANQKMLIIPAHEVSIEFDEKTKLPKKYIWNVGDENAGIKAGVSFPVNEVCHVQRANPDSMWWGLSPVVAGRRSILFNRYSTEFLNTFFEKGATPQMIVETEISHNPEAIKTLAKSFELVNGGRKNQRRPLVLPKGAKVTQVNMTIADTQLKEFIAQNRESIIALWRIPKHALGLQQSGSLGSEEHKTALRFMWTSAVKPMLKRFSTALTKFFQASGALQKGYVIDFDVSEVELANEDLMKKAELAEKLSKTHTLNEVRRIIWESEPIEGGDIIPGILPPPAQQYEAPVVEPEPEQSEKQIEAVAVTTREKMQDFDKFLASDSVKKLDETIANEESETAPKLEKIAIELLLRQLKKALEVAKNSLKSKAKIDKDDLIAEILGELLKDQNKFVKDYMGTLSNTLEVGYNSQLGLVFNPKNRDALERLRAETIKGRRSILNRLAEQRFAEISKTTSNRIVEEIAKGVEDGATVTAIAQSLSDSFSQLVYSRSRTIARTETLTALTIGQQSAAKNAAKVMPKAKKVWITAKDSRVRGNPNGKYPEADVSHWEAHGDIVGIGEKFDVDGIKADAPRDPKVSNVPAFGINCRCTMAIVAPEDLGDLDL